MNKEEKSTGLATLFERICAFFIDMFILFFIVNILITPFQKNYDNKYSDELVKTTEEYRAGKISTKVYYSRYSDINYDMTKQQGLFMIIEIFIYVLYFVVLQYKLKGQTLGKKLMRIRVKKDNESELEINDLIFRSLLINSILFNTLLVCIVLFTNKDIYLYGNLVLILLQYAFIFLTVVFVAVRSKKQGLHDLVAHTIVVKDKKIN